MEYSTSRWAVPSFLCPFINLIRQRLLTAQSRQKSYADVRRRPLEFEVRDHVFLKVMPKRGVVRFA